MTKETTPIQAPRYTENRRKSDTENARTIANSQAWSFDENDRVLDENGRLIGYTIEDIAAAMLDEGWLLPRLWRTDWSAVPGDGTAASVLRARLDNEGKHRGRWGL
ncbi:hypothetical protein AB0N71_18030 [Pseudarthrobacter enclensis]|uniref:hypothetical protein n=1 Tax=Pseudarthrobacter enclensis TaxID=993070 RepID=UPI0034131588